MQTKKSIEKVLFKEELVKGILGADERCSKPKMKTTTRGPFTFTNANNNSTVEISHGSIIEASSNHTTNGKVYINHIQVFPTPYPVCCRKLSLVPFQSHSDNYKVYHNFGTSSFSFYTYKLKISFMVKDEFLSQNPRFEYFLASIGTILSNRAA